MGDFARNEKKNKENGKNQVVKRQKCKNAAMERPAMGRPASGQSCIFQYLTFKFNIYVYRPRLPFWQKTSPWVRLIYETDLAVI